MPQEVKNENNNNSCCYDNAASHYYFNNSPCTLQRPKFGSLITKVCQTDLPAWHSSNLQRNIIKFYGLLALYTCEIYRKGQ